jgi:hypothetical protein
MPGCRRCGSGQCGHYTSCIEGLSCWGIWWCEGILWCNCVQTAIVLTCRSIMSDLASSICSRWNFPEQRQGFTALMCHCHKYSWNKKCNCLMRSRIRNRNVRNVGPPSEFITWTKLFKLFSPLTLQFPRVAVSWESQAIDKKLPKRLSCFLIVTVRLFAWLSTRNSNTTILKTFRLPLQKQ